MPTQENLPDQAVVVGVDGSGPSHSALLWAAREAAVRRLPLVICHAYQPARPGADWEVDGSLRNRALRTAHDAVRTAELESPELEVHSHVALGPVARVLREAVWDPALFVLGRHRRSQSRHLMAELLPDGFDPSRLARPVVLVRANGNGGRSCRGRAPVVLAVDSADGAETAGPFALASAAARGTRVEVVPVARTGDHLVNAALRTFRRLARDHPGVPVAVLDELQPGGPIVALAKAADRAGLLVGSTGRQGFLSSSLAHAVVSRAACPVALIPHRPGARTSERGLASLSIQAIYDQPARDSITQPRGRLTSR